MHGRPSLCLPLNRRPLSGAVIRLGMLQPCADAHGRAASPNDPARQIAELLRHRRGAFKDAASPVPTRRRLARLCALTAPRQGAWSIFVIRTTDFGPSLCGIPALRWRGCLILRSKRTPPERSFTCATGRRWVRDRPEALATRPRCTPRNPTFNQSGSWWVIVNVGLREPRCVGVAVN